MHQLAVAFAKAGISPTDAATLSRSKKMLERLARDIHGDEIDCSGKPFIPQGWTYDENDKDRVKSAFRGKVKAGQIFANLHLEEGQKTGVVNGETLKLALEGKLVLTAHCLDFVLRPENQHLIPDELKGKALFFWGSIYRHSGGCACVRFLCWDGEQWCWDGGWIGNDFDAGSPGALLA